MEKNSDCHQRHSLNKENSHHSSPGATGRKSPIKSVSPNPARPAHVPHWCPGRSQSAAALPFLLFILELESQKEVKLGFLGANSREVAGG